MRAVAASHRRAAANTVGLRYVSDARPGIARVRRGRGFVYLRGDRIVRDAATIARIRKLAIPPAWKDVWICPHETGHIQATGRDARGRKQYRYHPKWREARDGNKYDRLPAFAQALPKIRARVAKDLRRRGLPREKVLATVVRLLDETGMRVGNDEYRRHNGSHGLTTLRDRHARIGRGKVAFDFQGKSGKRHVIEVDDAKLARIVKRCQDLPGQELFQYVDAEGKVCEVGSSDVNAYLREAAGGRRAVAPASGPLDAAFTAKDFRTWTGTVLAFVALRDVTREHPHAPPKRNVVRAIERVAGDLGNTPTVCRRCYVHPDVLDAYLEGAFARIARTKRARVSRLDADERAVLALLARKGRS